MKNAEHSATKQAWLIGLLTGVLATGAIIAANWHVDKSINKITWVCEAVYGETGDHDHTGTVIKYSFNIPEGQDPYTMEPESREHTLVVTDCVTVLEREEL